MGHSKLRSIISAAAIALASMVSTSASAVTITSYQQSNVVENGTGNWSYNYNSSTGQGTLNDGIVPDSAQNNLLLYVPLKPSLTFFLDGTYLLGSIEILSNFGNNNNYPGNLYSADVTINGHTETVFETGFGPTGEFSEFPENERLVLPDSLSSLSASSFTLSNFVTHGKYYSPFTALGEVQATAITAAVPEPATWAMMIIGFGGVGLIAYRRRRNPRTPLAA